MKKALRITMLLMSAWCSTCPLITAQADDLTERIQYSGHGMLFDKDFKLVVLDKQSIVELQNSMIEALKKNSQDNKQALQEIRELETQLRKKLFDAEESIVVRAKIVRTLLRRSDDELRLRYEWRNDALMYTYLSKPGIHTRAALHTSALLRKHGFTRKPTRNLQGYERDCGTEQVPIPPDWAETGTPWVYQGTLTENLLRPGEYAAVWTYSDPNSRGACIALPRKDVGGNDTNLGIICQSARTGRACFWDNRSRTNQAGLLPWTGQTLVVAQLAGGDVLRENCTNCHHGNNVFLISPDDPTWAKLLRGPLTGPNAGNFTTGVEASSDNQGGPRYVPVSGQIGWSNTFTPGGCSGACHEIPTVRTPTPMPPNCGTNCYAASAPPHSKPVACHVFDDGSANMSSLSEAIYFADPRTACIPDGTARGLCRRWFGNCVSTTDNLAVTFKVFNDGEQSPTALSTAVQNASADLACIPNGSTTSCRKWFGSPVTADGHLVECYLFDDGLSNWIGPTAAMLYRGPGQVCMPDTGNGACRKWFGNCQVTAQLAARGLTITVNPTVLIANTPQSFTVTAHDPFTGYLVTQGQIFLNNTLIGNLQQAVTATFTGRSLPKHCVRVPAECEGTPRVCTKPHTECDPAEFVVDDFVLEVRASGYINTPVQLTIEPHP